MSYNATYGCLDYSCIDGPFRRRQSARLVRKCDFQARSFDAPNSVCGLRLRGAGSGRS
jgi:hypothetical protein